MVEAVIMALIYLAVLVLLYYVITWALGALGISIPANVLNVIFVIIVLIAILVIWRAIGPSLHLPSFR